MLRNKTAIECWNILKYEIESGQFVSLKKQGKRSRKKHFSKYAIRTIANKQTMWRVYRRTRKDEDYTNYKDALNAATNEIRQSKSSNEQKCACNIKQMTAKVSMHISGVNKTYETSLAHKNTVLEI